MTHSSATKVVSVACNGEVCGWLGDALKLRVRRAAAETGKANKAGIALLAGTLHLPALAVVIERGAACARKAVSIDALDAAELRRRIAIH